jgi:hypothetical protein
MATLARHFRRDTHGRRPLEGLLLLPVAILLAAGFLALGYVAHVLWPRWPEAPVALDAPTLPIAVSGVTFNVPPAAIRVPLQRRAGAQERLDLVFLWPSLTPPEPTARPSVDALSPTSDRIFVTITASAGTLAPTERLRSIYPRYLQGVQASDAVGLTVMKFSDGSPYRGEDLAYDRSAPDRFLARCSRNGTTRGHCLAERRVADAEITVRFPSDWIADWRNVADGIDRLIAQLRSSAS